MIDLDDVKQKGFIFTLFLLLSFYLPVFSQEEESKVLISTLKLTDEEKQTMKQAAYILGYKEALILRESHYHLNQESLLKGMKDGFYSRISKPELLKKKTDIIERYLNSIEKSKKPALSTIKDFSYLIGVDFGKDFGNKFFPFYPEIFIKGLLDSVSNKDPEYNVNDTLSLDRFYKYSQKLKEEYNNSHLFALSNDKLKKLNNSIYYQIVKDGKGVVTDFSKPYESITMKVVVKNSAGSIVFETPQEGIAYRISELLPAIKECLSIMKTQGEAIFYLKSNLLTGSTENIDRLTVDITLINTKLKED